MIPTCVACWLSAGPLMGIHDGALIIANNQAVGAYLSVLFSVQYSTEPKVFKIHPMLSDIYIAVSSHAHYISCCSCVRAKVSFYFFIFTLSSEGTSNGLSLNRFIWVRIHLLSQHAIV